VFDADDTLATAATGVEVLGTLAIDEHSTVVTVGCVEAVVSFLITVAGADPKSFCCFVREIA